MKVKGLKKLENQFKRMPGEIREEIKVALAQAAREITDLMENLVPKDTGLLAGSIGWVWGDKVPKGAFSLMKVRAGTTDPDLLITIYAGDREAYYGRWVEFGTKAQAAHPFFYPAYRAMRKRVNALMRTAIRRGIKRAAAGG